MTKYEATVATIGMIVDEIRSNSRSIPYEEQLRTCRDALKTCGFHASWKDHTNRGEPWPCVTFQNAYAVGFVAPDRDNLIRVEEIEPIHKKEESPVAAAPLKWYHMVLKFELDVSVRHLNSVLNQFHSPRLVANNALVYRVEQTVPFLPDDKAIEQYAEVIKQACNANTAINFDVERVRFIGFEKIEVVEGKSNESIL